MKILDKTIKMLEKSNLLLTIKVSREEFSLGYEQILKDLLQQVEIKGFRKGKVPREVIEKRYAESIKSDLLNKIVKESLEEVIQDLPDNQKPLALAPPKLVDSELKVDFNNDFEFTVEYDVYPKVIINKKDGLEVSVQEVEVNDADVDEKLQELRERNGVSYEKDGVLEKGDYVVVKYQVFENENKIDETQKFSFTLGEGQNYYELDEELLSLKKGDVKEFTKTFPSDFKTKSLADKELSFKVEILGCRRKELPELSDEFAKDVDESVSSLSELKEKIKKQLLHSAEHINSDIKQNAILDEIVKSNEVTVPDSMVNVYLEQRWANVVKQFGGEEKIVLNLFKEQGKSKTDVLSSWKDSALEDVKRDLFIGELSKMDGFEATEEDFLKEIEHHGNKDDDYYKREEVIKNVKEGIKINKIFLDLILKNKVEIKEHVSISNYLKNY